MTDDPLWDQLPTDQAAAAKSLSEREASLKFGKSGKLRAVSLPEGLVADESLWQSLLALADLIHLEAAGVVMTAADFERLGGLTQLTQLDLRDTALRDADLACLYPLHKLKLLKLSGCELSRDALKPLRQKLLGARIVF